MTSLHPPDQDVDTLDLTIRFSASLPDVLLSIPISANATTATLKTEIRARLPDEYSKRRIRLIYAGKALADETSLATTLKRPSSHAPSRSSTPIPSEDLKHASKGKAPVRDPPLASRIYIHCSIGDVVLSPTELIAEASVAQSTSPSTSQSKDAPPHPESLTAPPARGFDRLLTAGFSISEVQNLRLQFLAIQAHTHTPETMPSPSTLRALEDQWLDSSDSNTSPGQMGAGLGDEEGRAGHLDDMIWGATMGFFWPIGCILWAFREEGIWSRRRKMAVVIGLIVNAGFGTLRYMR